MQKGRAVSGSTASLKVLAEQQARAIEDLFRGTQRKGSISVPTGAKSFLPQKEKNRFFFRGAEQKTVSAELMRSLSARKEVLGVEPVVTVSALGEYVRLISLPRATSPHGDFLDSVAWSHPVEEIYAQKETKGAFSKRKYSSLSLADVGKHLAQIVLFEEHELKKPGIGFFMIREMSRGNPYMTVRSDAQNGKYEHERREWIMRHQGVRKFLARAAYPAMAKPRVVTRKKPAPAIKRNAFGHRLRR